MQAGTLVLGVNAQNPVFSLAGIDIQGGSLVLDYAGTSPTATIESILATSYRHSFAAGSAVIFNSTAAADGLSLGWADNGSGAITIMATLPGDANLDGTVDVNDLTVVLTNFGATGAVWSQGNFNYDGRVDLDDLTILLAEFGQTVAAPRSAAAVPEPAAIVLLGIGAIALLSGRLYRRK